VMSQYRQDVRALRRSKVFDLYDRYYDRLLLERILGPWESRVARRRQQMSSVSHDLYFEGDLPDHLGFIVATSRGLVVCRGNTVQHIIAGRYFGVTIRGTRVYAYEQVGMHGQIVSFELTDFAAPSSVHIWGLNRWIHQIDFLDDGLAVVDTLHNRILFYRDIGHSAPVHWSGFDRIIFPAGRDRKGRHSPSHRQFNSIYRSNDKIYVVAHNDSARTGRASEIWTFDARWRPIDISPVDGRSCHNLVPHQEGMLINWSQQKSLRLEGAEVYAACGFNRGLAYDGQYVLVGISPLAAHFADRENHAGCVDVLSNDFRRIGRLIVPNSNVRDIRITERDLGLSNNATPWNCTRDNDQLSLSSGC
jgi:hypothetical protein